MLRAAIICVLDCKSILVEIVTRIGLYIYDGNIAEMAAHAQVVNTRLFLSSQVLATNLAK